jgi:tetratricopeptide (TPR) repeat protein
VAHTLSEKFAALEETQPEVLARHWTEAGETELAIAQWSKAGKPGSRAMRFEAQESYQQALALLNLLPESAERDRRELELRLFTTNMLWITRGWASRDSIDAIERAASLAERSGNLKQLITLLLTKGVNVLNSGDSSAAVAIADRALDLAGREGNPIRLGVAYTLQVMVHYHRGDLTEAEEYYTAGLKFFEDPGFRLTPEPKIAAFAYASWNAWMLGRADAARERIGRMIVKENNPYDVALSEYYAAILRVLMRENEQSEALAAHALELSEKHRIPSAAATSRIILGQARARLGHTTEGIGLIREGIAGTHGLGSLVTLAFTNLAETQSSTALSLTRLIQSSRRYSLTRPNSIIGRRHLDYAANCASNRGKQNWPGGLLRGDRAGTHDGR